MNSTWTSLGVGLVTTKGLVGGHGKQEWKSAGGLCSQRPSETGSEDMKCRRPGKWSWWDESGNQGIKGRDKGLGLHLGTGEPVGVQVAVAGACAASMGQEGWGKVGSGGSEAVAMCRPRLCPQILQTSGGIGK